MHVPQLKYSVVYISPAIVVLGLYLGGLWSYVPLMYVFGLIPLLEFLFKGSTENLTPDEEASALNNRFYDIIIWLLVPFQLFILAFFLYRMADPSLLLWERIGMIGAYGLSAGALGINAAHELGHRVTWYEQLMSKILLSTSLYLHFFIEHNRGHHKNVSTDEDPASSRYGEMIYTFYFRTIIFSWLSAWKLEAKRLKAKGKSVVSLRNEMIWYQIIQAGMLVAITLIFDWQVMLCFVGGATIGFLLLETVNYIEHYGLKREKTASGHYETVMPYHSWNSNHSLGRILLEPFVPTERSLLSGSEHRDVDSPLPVVARGGSVGFRREQVTKGIIVAAVADLV